MDVMHLEKSTTNAGDVENSAMKQHGYVPTPLDGLDQASEKIKARNDQRNRIKQMMATKNNVLQPSNEQRTPLLNLLITYVIFSWINREHL
jgi:hypothetical protein